MDFRNTENDENNIITEIFPAEITMLTSCHILVNREKRPNVRQERQRIILREIIDKLGQASALAQGLPQVVTTYDKFQRSDHHLYILRDSKNDGLPIGFIRVGKKSLFLFDNFGDCNEVEPTCVLDFYVSGPYRRKGYGRRLFEGMLKEENLVATDLPIDSPSENMLNFMRKHYCSDSPVWQSNNFVVFPPFFTHVEKFMKPRKMRSAMSCVRPSQTSRGVGPGHGSLPTREITVRPTVCCADSAVQITPRFTNVPLPGAIEGVSNSFPKTDSPPTNPPVDDSTSARATAATKVTNVVAEKLPSAEVSKRVSTQSPNPAHSSVDSSRSAVQSSNPLLSLKHFETICQLSVRPRSYSYQSAVRTHNKHTRLW